MCRWKGYTFQKYTQSHSVHQEQAKDKGYKPLQLCDSLQIVYNSELKRYHKSWAMWKYKQMPSNAAMCDIWRPVPSTILYKTENHVACRCHLVLFQCEKICGKDILSWQSAVIEFLAKDIPTSSIHEWLQRAHEDACIENLSQYHSAMRISTWEFCS